MNLSVIEVGFIFQNKKNIYIYKTCTFKNRIWLFSCNSLNNSLRLSIFLSFRIGIYFSKYFINVINFSTFCFTNVISSS